MRLLSALGLVALLLATSAPAWARGPEWEELILDGIRRQDTRLREVSLDAVVRDHELLAGRPSTGAVKVARLYLLGRAYGKRASAPGSKTTTSDLASARRVLQEVLQLEPACYFAHRDLGILALQETPPNAKEAEAGLQRALAANPSYVQALRDLSRLCTEQGRAADTIVHLKRVIDLEPTDQQARALLVLALVEAKRLEEARREVDGLLKSQPTNAMFLDVRAEVELAAGAYDTALSIWRALQAENPSATKPLWGQWRALTAKGKANQPVSREELRAVVDRLFVLERDPGKRAKLKELGDALRAPPPDPNAPPDDATLVRGIAGNDEQVRAKALTYIAFRREKPSIEVLRGVIARIDPQRENVEAVRATALGVLAQHGGYGLLGLVRHSLRDPGPKVRQAATLACEAMGEQSDSARRASFLILGLFGQDPDRDLAAAARSTTMRQGGLLPSGEEGSEEQQRAEWLAWWHGAMGVDLKIRALAVYPEIQDKRADQVLLEYLDDPDLHVMEAAYRALIKCAPTISDPVVAEWIGRVPRFLDGSFTPEKREEITRSLKTWRAMRPTSR